MLGLVASFSSPAAGLCASNSISLPVLPPGQTGFTLLAPEQTGIFFTNTLSEWASAQNRVLNNGSGVAAGDFDNDGRTDLFFCGLNAESQLFRNLGAWRFEDVTRKAGLSTQGALCRGAVFADVDGDAWLDLLVSTANQGVLCFLNDRRGNLTNATAHAGIASPHGPHTLALADIDSDGTLDLYVANYRTDDVRDWFRVPVIFVNKKPTVPPHLRDRLRFENGQLQEFGEPDILFRNDGRGRFKPIPWTDGAFLDERGNPLARAPFDWGLTAALRDINDDGAPDLYVCNDYWTPDRLWINTGSGSFRACAPPALRKTSANSMAVDFADINRDGHLDFFVVDMLSRSPQLRRRQIVPKAPSPPRIGDLESRPQAPQNTLFLNRGDGTFAEIARLAGVAASDWSWSTLFLDADLDGFEDVLIASGHVRDFQDADANQKVASLQDTWRRAAGPDERAFVAAKREHTKLYPLLRMPVVAFHNLRNTRFQEVTPAWGLDQPAINHGMALADLDNDGDLDLAINRLEAPAAVFRNDTAAPRVAVRLRGRPPNTQAIGAKIELIGGAAPNQKAEVTCGGSYLSGSDTLRVFAPGDAQENLQLHIVWRNGARTEIPDVKPNRLYEISEGTAEEEPEKRAPSPPLAEQIPFFRDVSHWLRHTHHEEPFNDFERQPLLPHKLSQSGPGVAWFDIDRDSWDDLIVGSGRGGRMAVLMNLEGKSFELAPASAHSTPLGRDQATILAWRTPAGHTGLIAGSASYEDSDPGKACALFYDHSIGTFQPALPGHTASVGPMALADIDGDGDLDLFVGGQVVPGRYPIPPSSVLFRQSGGNWVLDVDSSLALRDVGLVNGAVWSDLTGDGLPELVLACEWGPVRVLSLAGGKLQEVTHEWGLDKFTGLWRGVTTGDLNGDGLVEIIAANWGYNVLSPREHPHRIYFGDLSGQGHMDILEAEWDPGRAQPIPTAPFFTLLSALPFLAERFPNHLAYSRASIPDLLRGSPGAMRELQVTTLASTVFFNRQGKFEASELPLEAQFAPAFAVNVADFDGDGKEDVFLSQNLFAFRLEEARLDSGRGLWLRGDGTGRLSPVPAQISGIQIYGEQRGAALADFDHDGRIDLVVTQNGAATKLYQNQLARPGLRVRLRGPSGNPDAIGAQVRLRYDGAWGPSREIHAGSGWWSQDGSVPVLASTRVPTAVWVRWPGGQTTEHPIPLGAVEVTVP